LKRREKASFYIGRLALLTESLRRACGVPAVMPTRNVVTQNIDKVHCEVARPGGLELPTFCFVACFDAVAIKGPILNPEDLIVPHRLLCFLRPVA
jgi:hypothetical protein